MKSLVLFLLISFVYAIGVAQNELYYGGVGRGDVHLTQNNILLGDPLIYYGGVGRGDVHLTLSNINLDNPMIFYGGVGRGDVHVTQTNIPLGENNPLPVELLSLTAICASDKKLVLWSTASEKDAWYFQPEYSLDGQNWFVGDEIPAAGNSNSLLNYEWYLDNRHYLVYLRLQQFDIDGVITTYGPIVLNCENENYFTLFPNPTWDAVNIVFSSQLAGSSFSIEIQDLEGKKVFEKQFTGTVGTNLQYIPTNFNPGIYLLGLFENNILIGRKQLVIQ
jgi:hypothetical protein